MIMQYFPHSNSTQFILPSQSASSPSAHNVLPSSISSFSSSTTRRRVLSLSLVSAASFYGLISSLPPPSLGSSLLSSSSSKFPVSDFFEIPNSGGVKALDLLDGSGEVPTNGDQVAIHYYGRLAAKQGWRFDSTYDHKDDTGEPNPFVFILGFGKVIPGIEAAVRSMKVGGIRRVIIPPSQGYQNTSQEPIPPNGFDRRDQD
ncbi:peptidyl-prolyl cis-trans isomerase FKBP17-1, chloroplastic isoform X2 [Neltuma alba]|uniref:peptidyl-prolyl cis-trans isomerase FKBP17-1, chloroplastic isoform X2 n=1 Tax=Neltuma alba TaxID=207710 RepID=UPI0010A2AE05|nr:peptidyl-prolyl cis-trans isomerase FKBP17-1, chloroplastic-like isoform X2 [Prosopis alba]